MAKRALIVAVLFLAGCASGHWIVRGPCYRVHADEAFHCTNKVRVFYAW